MADKRFSSEYLEDLRSTLPLYARISLRKNKRGQYICPFCGSGSGQHGTGAFRITRDGRVWTCFSCGRIGDVFQLVGQVEGKDHFPDQVRRAAEASGIAFIGPDGDQDPIRAAVKKQPMSTRTERIGDSDGEIRTETLPDQTRYFLVCNKRLGETDYYRGITRETLDRFVIGYDPSWRHPNVPETVPTSPRLIIPISRTAYLARDTRQIVPESCRDYVKQRAGKMTRPFNGKAMKTAEQPIFIVEGEIDAMSICDVGGLAVGLGSVCNVGVFFRYLDEECRSSCGQPFIVLMDNDGSEAARKASRDLSEGLSSRSLPFYLPVDPGYILGDAKDANEALQTQRGRLTEAVKVARRCALEAAREAAEGPPGPL